MYIAALVPILILVALRFFPQVAVYGFMLVDFHTSWKLFESPLYAQYHEYIMSTKPEIPEAPIPELHFSNFTPEDVRRLSKDYTFPVVIRGLLENSTAVEKWLDKTWWRENYGNEQILCGSFDNVRPSCTINDFFDEVETGKPFYITGASKIFTRNPELAQMVEHEKIPPFEPGRRVSTQIFMGMPDMGSDIHSAMGVNLFRQISGRKKWWFIPPSQTAFLKASFNVNGFSSHTQTKIGKNGDKPSPWLSKVVRYTTVLQPGDLLINPPWFWHGILNLGEPGDIVIGVPTRYAAKDASKAAFKSNFPMSVVAGLTVLKQYGSMANYYKIVDSGGDVLEAKIEANRIARGKDAE